jgi:hypothetical protein
MPAGYQTITRKGTKCGIVMTHNVDAKVVDETQHIPENYNMCGYLAYVKATGSLICVEDFRRLTGDVNNFE